MASNVIEALACVIDEMEPIEKGGQASQQQGGYKYRGIEQITKAVAPLLAKHGVVFVPQVTGIETRELTVNSKPWTDTILTVRYRICGPGGPEDYVEATVVGIGRDNSDKGANKALTQAFKYALTQTLCVSDARDDADGEAHEADEPARGPVPAPKVRIDMLTDAIAMTPDPESVKAWVKDQGFPWPWTDAACDAIEAEVHKIARAGGEASAPPAVEEHAPPSPPAGEPHGMDLWPKDDLVAECQFRGLPHSGTKDKLVAELRADSALKGIEREWDERPV